MGCHFVLSLILWPNNSAFPTPEPVFRILSVFSGNPESPLCGAVCPPPLALSRAGNPGACVCCEG